MTAPRLASEVPKRMRTLPRDRRGFPVPFVVLVDDAGRPHFTVNDVRKVARAARTRLCAICGKRMAAAEGYWFVGGPGSALHPGGRYLDGPTHEECARFALAVCPYLAAPRYGRRIDGATLNPAHLPATLLTYDPSMDDERPALFCLGRARDYALVPGDGEQPYFNPERPWQALEFWRHGQQLDPAEGGPIAREHVRRLLESGRGVAVRAAQPQQEGSRR